MRLSDLKRPFDPRDVSWRIQQAGITKDSKPWGRCLAYVDARAIQYRLDEVCGVENWKVEYQYVAGGTLCGLSIKCGEEWVTKWDGSDETDIEAFKGGISKALVRAASVWGIGRYLYDLPPGWAQFVEKGEYTREAKIENKFFHWLPPELPKWALPGYVGADKPGMNDGNQGDGAKYMVPFGKFVKRSLDEIDLGELRGYVNYLEGKAEKDGKAITGVVKDFIDRACSHIAAFENQGEK